MVTDITLWRLGALNYLNLVDRNVHTVRRKTWTWTEAHKGTSDVFSRHQTNRLNTLLPQIRTECTGPSPHDFKSVSVIHIQLTRLRVVTYLCRIFNSVTLSSFETKVRWPCTDWPPSCVPSRATQNQILWALPHPPHCKNVSVRSKLQDEGTRDPSRNVWGVGVPIRPSYYWNIKI